ncbi:MAG: hypothetical protein LBR23_02865 [Spirochaetaceae bacterium]|jgi:hypothetical protein|nr:hypothetical protein [Spirochaetaceae bacterium]
MRGKILLGAAAAAALAALGTVIFFHAEAPAESAWRGYKTLYVDRDFPEERVLALCEGAGVGEVVSLSGQRPPIESPYLPVREHLSFYAERRANFFFDKSLSYKLYYIDERYGSALPALRRDILRAGAGTCGINVPRARNRAASLVCALVFLLFAALSRERAVMFLGGLLPAALAFRLGEETLSAGVCLGLWALFLVQRAWGARGFWGLWVKKLPVPIALALALGLTAAGSPVHGGLFLLTMAGGAGILYLYQEIQAGLDRRLSFLPLRILPARAVTVMTGRPVFLLALPAGGALILLCLFLFGGRAQASGPGGPAMPAPSFLAPGEGFGLDAYGDFIGRAGFVPSGDFPSLAELLSLEWESLSFPNRPLGPHGDREGGLAYLSAPALIPGGGRFSVSEYTQEPGGKIQAAVTEYVFDESFISGIISRVERVLPPAIERVLIRQGRFALVAYSGSGGPGGMIPVFVLIAQTVVPLIGMALFLKGKKFV